MSKTDMPSPVAGAGSVSAKSRLLIIDDDARGREALAGLLRNEGYEVIFAEDGEQGLRQAKALLPDLILLDVMMPGLDGFEVCRRLRAESLLAEVPVILLTALSDRESRLRGIEAGADDYIAKPFDTIELCARIRTITRLNRYRRLTVERDKFAWVVEASDDGFVLLDKAGRLSYANPQACFFLHTEQGEECDFLQQACRYYHLEPAQNWEGWPRRAETRYLVRPESQEARALWLQVESFVPPASPDDGLLVRLRDITAQMNLQQQSWTFQRLVSHKLRTPLMGLTALQLAKRQITEVADAKTVQLYEMAEQNVQRLHQQIMDILRYVDAPNLLQSGVKITPEGVCRLVDELRESLAIDIELRIPSQFTETLCLSDDALKCILEELLCNARKFHPHHQPQVLIEIGHAGHDKVRITFTDNGRYVAQEELSKVWLPYYQPEKKFTGEVKGMGLGLPTVASLVWRSGGDCRLRNRKDGPGVVVELILPRQKPV
jgi:CheY-like chemotaxis protein/signal transduction histidine kinase